MPEKSEVNESLAHGIYKIRRIISLQKVVLKYC